MGCFSDRKRVVCVILVWVCWRVCGGGEREREEEEEEEGEKRGEGVFFSRVCLPEVCFLRFFFFLRSVLFCVFFGREGCGFFWGCFFLGECVFACVCVCVFLCV